MNWKIPLATGTLCLLTAALTLNPAIAKPPAPYHQITEWDIGGSEYCQGLIFNVDPRFVFIAHDSDIVMADADSGKPLGDLASLTGLGALALDDGRGRIYVACSDGQVRIVDTDNATELCRLPIGHAPVSAVYDSVSDLILVFDSDSQSATIIDPARLVVAGSVPIGARPGACVVDGLGRVFVALPDSGRIARVDTQGATVVERWNVGSVTDPQGLAVDNAGARLFASCANDQLVVTNLADGHTVTTIPIGKGPHGCAYDPKNHLLFCANGGDGTLTVIKQTTPDLYEVLETDQTQPGAHTITLDLEKHRVLLAGVSAAPAQGGHSPFAMLVFGRK